jgi:hypothetical protein
MSDLRGTVRCDTCKEEIADQVLREWIDKLCHRCRVPYMTPSEVAALRYVQFLMDVGLVSQGGEKTGVAIHIDTAELRATKGAVGTDSR